MIKTNKQNTKVKVSKAMEKKNTKLIMAAVSGGAKLYVNARLNNTILSFTDFNGNVIKQVSCGSCKFKNSKKSMSHASHTAIRVMLDYITAYTTKIHLIVRGCGLAREMLNMFNINTLEILSICDDNNLAYGGCRQSRAKH